MLVRLKLFGNTFDTAFSSKMDVFNLFLIIFLKVLIYSRYYFDVFLAKNIL